MLVTSGGPENWSARTETDPFGQGVAWVVGRHEGPTVTDRRISEIDVTAAADAAGMTRLERIIIAEGWSGGRSHGGGRSSGPDFVRFVSADAVMTDAWG
jgi:hypothetical protein